MIPESPSTLAASKITASGVAPLERRIFAIATIVLLDVVLLAIGAAGTAFVLRFGRSAILPEEPLHIFVVALLAAQCSLVAVWWAGVNWPFHAKTLFALLTLAGLWALLLGVLHDVNLNSISAAGWGLALTAQVVITGLATLWLELALNKSAKTRSNRFSILSLLIWTTLVAGVLGATRAMAHQLGWTLPDLWNWEFLGQLRCFALANAVMAVALVASIRQPIRWLWRGIVCGVIVLVAAISAPLVMFALFGMAKAGPSIADLIWLWTAEGLFLIAALVPLERVRTP
jgi:hypothetical protein